MVDILEFVSDKDEFTTEEIIGQGIIAQCLLNVLGPHVKSSFTVLAGLFAETDPLTVKYL